MTKAKANTTPTELIETYDKRIKYCAQKVAGTNTAILADLEQVGRLKLLALWGKSEQARSKFWTWAESVIMRDMYRRHGGLITVSDNRRKTCQQSEELSGHITADSGSPLMSRHIDTQDQQGQVLARLEQLIEALPLADRQTFTKHLKALEAGNKGTLGHKQKLRWEALIAQVKTEALEALQT